MATHDKDSGGKFELSRRDFLKAGATAAVAGAVGADFAVVPSRAEAHDVANSYHTTCPYCSAQCGQIVDVDASGNVLDVYGDWNNPTSRGGLCAKGASAYQLVTNARRLGVPEHTAYVDGMDFTGTAWKRIGDGAWTNMPLDTAMTEIASGDGVNHVGLKAIRGAVTPGSGAASNAKSVMFFGSSHMNNEQNYLYRKIVATFGTSQTEHQARI
ncbi:MAG: twin-arginine translocation signal domain-containing protein [Coriobacteriia bacterium]